MKKLVVILLVGVFISGCFNIQGDRKDNVVGEMNEMVCKESNGNWNECSSPCLGTDAKVCVMMCVAQCECGGVAGWSCPEGYSCRLSGKIADELGVCVKE